MQAGLRTSRSLSSLAFLITLSAAGTTSCGHDLDLGQDPDLDDLLGGDRFTSIVNGTSDPGHPAVGLLLRRRRR